MAKIDFENEIKRILDDLKKYDPEKIILFGSAARGEITEDSDIDVLIIKKTNKRFVDRIGDVLRLWKAGILALEPIVLTPAEFKRMQAEKRFFIENILKEGKVVYEKR